MGTLWQFFGFPDPEAPAPESVKKSRKRKPKAEEPPGQQLTLVSPDDAETTTEAAPAKLEPVNEPVKELETFLLRLGVLHLYRKDGQAH